MTTFATKPASGTARLKLTVRGAVQGVGFRPAAHRLATELGLCGWVNNSPQGVVLEVEGPREVVKQFLLRLETEKPPRSFIQSLESSWLGAAGYTGFEIRASRTSGGKTALVLPDIGTCPDCLREILDPANRRHRYPFTNCTNCGPRFSIIEALPYDRANTSMKKFMLCPACQDEYDDPSNRRFHAQPNACPACGPHLELWQCAGVSPFSALRYGHRRDACPTRNDALLAAAEAIRRGQIAAVKGIGGFHLMVDARNETAVRRLRERKHREEKPFALMFPSLAGVKTACEVSSLEERLLCSLEAPIVLLEKIANRKSQIANAVAPGNPNLGVMLPSNPLHHLLLAELGFPVVATSGNLCDEPICTDEREALERLRDIADVFLVHNRPIVRPLDDSIVRVMCDREMVLRRARGYAPLPICLSSQLSTLNHQPVLAVGAHLKNTVALSVGDQVFISQHIGDLETEQANAAFERVATDLPKLYDARPEMIVADLHPDYVSTKFAQGIGRVEQPPGQNGPPRAPAMVKVQHHVAHVLSCMAENTLAPPVLGVAWDGTGYGLDGTIWGGEFFRITDNDVERVAHLRPFRLPGGDAAVKEPRRAALGLFHELFSDHRFCPHPCKPLEAFSAAELTVLTTMLARGLNSPSCSSVGRLFDAVASFTGLCQRMRFEGQAAMAMEFALGDVVMDETYEWAISHQPTGIQLDWSPMIQTILAEVERNIPAATLSAKFHNALAEAIVAVAKQVGEPRVALSGGCFQNRYLTERSVKRLRAEGFQPYWHQRVPPNDGGIALGQVIAARRQLTQKRAVFRPLRDRGGRRQDAPVVSPVSTLKRAEACAPSSRVTHHASH